MIGSRHVFADDDDPASLGNRLREKRFAQFVALTLSLPRPLRIIDLGGTNSFWEQRGWAGRQDVTITTVNLAAESQKFENIIPIAGDVTHLNQVADRSFDVAFSNSVIEHLRTFENQVAMASELRRVAASYSVQTPNYWFPFEPHFRTVGWHWLPESIRIALLRKRSFGLRGRCRDLENAREIVREIRLLTRSELKILFPSGTIWPERFLGLVKSWTVIGGFPRCPAVPCADKGC